MKRSIIALLTGILIIVVALASTEFIILYNLENQNQKAAPQGFYVGVSFCGNTTAQAELLIDKVKTYTNLFVVQSGPVSTNETAMNEIINYAVAAGLYVIASFGYFNPDYPWQVPWLDYAKQQWGSHFLGVYLNDEPGGKVIDGNWTGISHDLEISNNPAYAMHGQEVDLALNGSMTYDSQQASEAAYHFVADWQASLNLTQLRSRQIDSFTSDYALYWFDYLIGYNTIFAELGNNQSSVQAIDLVRGAARLQNETWGTIVTWTYDQAPYIENSTTVYNDLMTSYVAGAKYEIIFDYPQVGSNPYGILTDQDFSVLQKFWNTIHSVRVDGVPEAVLVLPQNYGWGMRTPTDLIWGIWRDNSSVGIWNILQSLVSQYGTKIDIVYQDPNYSVQGKYQQIYYWNQST